MVTKSADRRFGTSDCRGVPACIGCVDHPLMGRGRLSVRHSRCRPQLHDRLAPSAIQSRKGWTLAAGRPGPDSAYPVFSTPTLICCTGPKGVDGMVGPPDLSEGEAVGLSAWIAEGDLEGAVGDGAGLADELVHPLLREGAVAVGAGVGSVRLAGWLSVDTDAEPEGSSWCCWSHDEVEVAAVEAAGDLPARRVQRGGLLLHGPVPRQGPLVEPQPCRDGIDVRLARYGGGELSHPVAPSNEGSSPSSGSRAEAMCSPAGARQNAVITSPFL